MTLDAQIEAVLFWKAEPVSVKKLVSILEKTEAEVREGIVTLKSSLENRGLTLIELEDEVTLGTSKDLSGLIEKLTKEELMKDLGKAGLETLSIILYQGPILRSEIDYIRGVNS
ncbi:MAG: SMC-Scp complex subunit ScpB, partial [bacterium]